MFTNNHRGDRNYSGNNHKNVQHDRVTDLRYKTKYQKLKKRIKNLIFENAALADEIANVQGKLVYARGERRFLVKRLTAHENGTIPRSAATTRMPTAPSTSSHPTTSTKPSATVTKPSATITKHSSTVTKPSTSTKPQINQPNNATTTIRQQRKSNDVRNQQKAMMASTSNATSRAGTTANSGINFKSKQKTVNVKTSTSNATITSGSSHTKSILITKPDSKESLLIKYPIRSHNLVIHSIGEILPVNPNFHTKEWIYPVGYAITRLFAHPKLPQRKCVFMCKILNNSGLPQFQIIPDNDLDSVFFGDSARACHQRLLDTLQQTLGGSVKLPISMQGEIFFGLSDPNVQMLLKKDPGFKFCANFRGFSSVNLRNVQENEDPTINFEALQSLIALSTYHSMPEVKEEPPDELFNLS